MSKQNVTTRLPLSVRRMRFTLFAVLIVLVVLGARLVWVQGIDPTDAAAVATKNRSSGDVSIPAKRGQILDADGNVLATSTIRYDLVVDQRQVKDTFRRKDANTGKIVVAKTEDGVRELAQVLGLDAQAVHTAFFGKEGAKKKGYSVITKNITPEANDKAREIGLTWLASEETTQRSYPSGKLAGPVLGFIDSKGKGAEGLELSQNARLTGKDGSMTYERGADGVRIPNAPVTEEPATDGQSVKLTLDSDIQYVAQNAVMAKQKQFKAQWVNAVVIDAKTSKILALADSTSMDPNNPGATEAQYRTSTTVTQAFEPGSTGKIATFAAALDQGVVTPETQLRVPNAYKIDKETINDSLKHQTFDMTAAGVFARSYNTGTVQVGDKLSDASRYDFMSKVGLGKKIDVGLPGANAGILAKPDQWERRQRLTTMFGQGYTQTAMHTASILQAVANKGVQVAPTLIDSYVDADGTEHKVEPAKTQRVVSEETSAKMRRMMETVVTDGTSSKMAIKGYRVGGKSGTAQAQGDDGKFDQHTSSFAGMVPVEDPRYIVVVTMQHPQGYWRDWSVGNTFTTIMSSVLSKYSVAPDTTKPNPYKAFVGEQQKYGW